MFSFFKRSKSQKGKQKQQEKCSPVPPTPAKADLRDDRRTSVGAGPVVTKDAYAGAPSVPPSHDGDEEQAAKNSFPAQPPTPQPVDDRVAREAKVPGRVSGSPELPQQRQQQLPPKCSDTFLGERSLAEQRSATFASAIDDRSSSVSTRPNGPYRTRSVSINDGDDDNNNEGITDRRPSSPTDERLAQETDSKRDRGDSPSSNRYAPQSESAMAKGKSRRRNYQQQQQNHPPPPSQPVKVNPLQSSAALGDSSAQVTVIVDQTLGGGCGDVKVKEGPCDVIGHDVSLKDCRAPSQAAHERSPIGCLAETQTIGNGAVSPPNHRQHDHEGNDDDDITNTDASRAREELLNIKNISPTTAGGVRLCASVEGDDPPWPLPGRSGELVSASSAVSSAVSLANGPAPPVATVGSSSVVVVDEKAAVPEMGQQPSRSTAASAAATEHGPRSRSSSKSVSPPPPPLPPPRGLRVSHPSTGYAPGDAPGDDTSDDRDVFYEATETLSPGLDGLGKAVPSPPSLPASPEPIRASLVLKIAESTVGTIEPAERLNGPSVGGDGRKKQVSFRLTQNGSDDVEVTSPTHDSDSDDRESGTGSDSDQRQDDSEASDRSLPAQSPGPRYAGDGQRRNAFSDKRDYIEFQYDNSVPSPDPAGAGHDKKDAQKDMSESTVVVPGTGSGGTDLCALIEDSVLPSLPDVVRPTSIEPSFGTVEKLNSDMKDLVNQESRYSAKLSESEKRANDANGKVYELQQKLDAVERDASLKEYNVERLRAELEATLRECEGIRARLRTQEAEMEAIRLRSSEREDELNLKYQNLEIEHIELNEKLKEVRQLAHDLNSQLIDARTEVDNLKEERQKLLDARAEEQKIMREALEESVQQRALVEAKWKHDFEQLRNVNNDREEHLMQDCEFTIRNMQKSCKERMETVEKERKQALDKVTRLEEVTRKQIKEVKQLKSYEAEVEQLRGLTYDQKEALATMTRQVEDLKAKLQTAHDKLEEELVKVQQIKNRCEYQLCEKEREALNRIEIARGEIAMQWEDRLLREMNRLKLELEQMHMEERNSAIEKIQRETMAETEAMSQRVNEREKQLKEEIKSLKSKIEQQKNAMSNAQSDADQKLLQSRMYVERAEREHEQKLAKQISEKDEIIENLKRQFEQEKQDLEKHFGARIQQVQEEFAREISDATEIMKSTHKKELESQWKTLIAEKEEALQLMESRNRNKLDDAENNIRELTTSHQRQLKDLHEEHGYVVRSLESRDTKNSQEIATLHKKCRCLTNLFEEMRLRYERRDPRPEDLRQIEELKNVIESQDRDLRMLTESLRELQLQQMEQQQQPPPPPRRSKPNRGKQGKQQQAANQGGKQQKKSRPQFPEPEDVQQQEELPEEPLADEYMMVNGEEYTQDPQVILVPPCQMMPPLVRTTCHVIYEENEADILREEEEAQLSQERHRQAEVDEEDYDDDVFEPPTNKLTDADGSLSQDVTVVDVPESAIHTEVRAVHSTAPTIIEEVEDETMPLKSTVVIPVVENVPATTNSTTSRSRESSAPRIVVTDECEQVKVGEPTTVVEITADDQSTAAVIELPAVYAKPYPAPADLPVESVGDTIQANPPAPEITVVRLPDGAAAHVKGSS
ncbi:uncharacterized protein LOC131205801 [Anopheles bellator]|uniref:uncharacterized protein LOC131205801 n=1 Tax=Anopheles bellator TaxID=139047 RepID=UPI002649D2BD|nr:uncharacterized protein LOC131205801 [Anopheles bellator]